MKIRCATSQDARRIATIAVEAWRVAYRGLIPDAILQQQSIEKREAFWAKQLSSGASHTLVAEEDGEVVGWIDFGKGQDVDEQSAFEVYAMYLDPSHVRCGIGTSLWRKMISEVMEQGGRRIAVWVLADNIPARRFYEAMGGTLDPLRDKVQSLGNVHLRESRYWFDFGRSIDQPQAGI